MRTFPLQFVFGVGVSFGKPRWFVVVEANPCFSVLSFGSLGRTHGTFEGIYLPDKNTLDTCYICKLHFKEGCTIFLNYNFF